MIQSSGDERVMRGRPMMSMRREELTACPSVAGKLAYDFGLEFPLYFNTNLLPDGKGVFKGIVRITPSVLRSRDLAGAVDTRFIFTLELLTGRSMFPLASDLL